MLKDRFGRIHDYLRVSLTDRCNFRCLYCLPASEFLNNFKGCSTAADQMSADEIISISKVFVELGVRKIRITGGEPLVRKDADEIISRLSALPVQLVITTNGSRVNEFIDTFVSAGIKSVNVSLDSLEKQNFHKLTHRDEFDLVMSNIQLLLQHGIHVKANMVVMKGYNDNEIHQFIEWTRNAPVHVRFIEFMPFPGNHWRPEKLIRYADILGIVNEKFPHIEKLEDGPHDTTRKYTVRGHLGTFAVISTMSEPFCSGCNRLRLTADGKMRNCLFGKTETDLLSALRAGHSLAPLIRESLYGKEFQLGGNSGAAWGLSETETTNRTMMGIGG